MLAEASAVATVILIISSLSSSVWFSFLWGLYCYRVPISVPGGEARHFNLMIYDFIRVYLREKAIDTTWVK